MRIIVLVIAVLAVGACAKTETMALSEREVMVMVESAPACSTGETIRIANQSAAIETIKRGYDRFIIAGGGAQKEHAGVISSGGNSYTTGHVTAYGNTAYGSATTTHSPTTYQSLDRNKVTLHVVLFRPGQPGYENAIDARSVLGANWQERVESGPSKTCG